MQSKICMSLQFPHIFLTFFGKNTTKCTENKNTFVVYFASPAEQSRINPKTISQFESKCLFYKQFLHTTRLGSIVFTFDALCWVALATFKEIHRSKIPLFSKYILIDYDFVNLCSIPHLERTEKILDAGNLLNYSWLGHTGR